MPFPREVLDLENADGADGVPTLARAFAILEQHWDKGQRDREVALHLLFLAWYGLIEPSHITGFAEGVSEHLRRRFQDVFDVLAPNIEQDAEAMYAVGLMADLAPWLLGDAHEWEARSKRFRALYRAAAPGGIDPARFEGRGAYGSYFGGQARGIGGY